MAKLAGLYRYQLLLLSAKRQGLHKLLDILLSQIEKLKLTKKVRWLLDVNPVDLYRDLCSAYAVLSNYLQT